MAGFYSRRMLRIAPALLGCVLVTMLVDALIVPEAGLSRGNAQTGIAALFGVSNLMLSHLANDYWAPTSEFNPFAHTWSLGMEEPFYLIFPLLYFAWAKGYRKQGMSALLLLMLTSIVLLVVWTRGAIGGLLCIANPLMGAGHGRCSQHGHQQLATGYRASFCISSSSFRLYMPARSGAQSDMG